MNTKLHNKNKTEISFKSLHVKRNVRAAAVLGIRIRIQGQENEEISVEKCTFYFFF
jgi:hypothetical protein